MRVILCVVVLLSVIGLAFSQTRPKISDVFRSTYHITVKTHEGTKTGRGIYDVNQPKKQSVQISNFEDGTYTHVVGRWDLSELFDISGTKEKSECTTHDVGDDMPDPFAWVAFANYTGKEEHGGYTLDIWTLARGAGTRKIGVRGTTAVVHYLAYTGNQYSDELLFDTWENTAPPENDFSVPTICNNKTTDLPVEPQACISGAEIMKRAEVWVAKKVPYNQGAEYGGYREDCSGYVSYAWDSAKPGHVTSTMHEIAKPISKASLADGDCLLWAAEHVVLFGGWANSAKTQYWAYEETRPGEGTVKRETPYPYWYSTSDFKPYRYDNKC